MIRRIFPALLVGASMLLASCYPVQEHPRRRPAPRTHAKAPTANAGEPVPVTEPLVSRIPPEKPEKTTKPGKAEPRDLGETGHPAPPPPRQAPPPAPVPSPAPSPAPEATNREYPTAQKAPGRVGFVLSPYSSKLILVRGIPSGTVVPDTTCPASQKKFFVVP